MNAIRIELRDADSPTWNGKRVTYDDLLRLLAEVREQQRSKAQGSAGQQPERREASPAAMSGPPLSDCELARLVDGGNG